MVARWRREVALRGRGEIQEGLGSCWIAFLVKVVGFDLISDWFEALQSLPISPLNCMRDFASSILLVDQ